MAHFAKLGIGNIIETVVVVSNDIATTEQAGVEFLQNLYKDRAVWKQTSFNTYGGKHWTFTKDENDNDIKVESDDQSKALRKNYAGIGFKYDQTRDAFIEPQPFNSWILNETTCLWESPVVKPETYTKNLVDENNNPIPDYYNWNEETQQWELDE
jgi:hypothetical protein